MRYRHLVIALFFCSVASAATFEPLGQPCRGFNVLATRCVTHPRGKDWFVLSNTNESTGVELIFIDPKTNTGKTYRAPAGQGAWLLNQVAPATLVVGTYYDGKLMIFDLNEMKFTKVIPFAGEEYFWNGAVGGDGRLYGGTYPHAKLGALDLKTLQLEDCGAPAPPNLYNRIVSAMPDGRIFCHFVTSEPVSKIYDPSTKKWSDPPEQLKKVERCVTWNGYLLSASTWDGKDAAGPVIFDGKTLQPIDPPPFPLPPGRGGRKFSVDAQMTTPDTLFLRSGNALYRYRAGEKELAKLFDQDLKGGAITAIDRDGDLLGIRGQDYIFVKAGSEKSELRPIPVEPGPRPMHFIRADDRGRLWGGPPFGQTLFWMDLATKKTTNTRTVCNAGGEVYDVAFGEDGKVYAVAYVGGDVIVYEPDKSWDQINDKNPRTLAHLTTRGYIRPTAGVKLKGGVLYSGWMASYGKYGGAIAVTDPKTGETELLENPLGQQPIDALELDEKFIYAGTGLHGNGLGEKPNEKPQFGMIDRATKKVVFQTATDAETEKIICEPKTGQILVVFPAGVQRFDPVKHAFTDVAIPRVNDRAIDTKGDGTVWFASETCVVHFDLASNKPLEKFDAPAKCDHLTLDKSSTVYVSSGPDLYQLHP